MPSPETDGYSIWMTTHLLSKNTPMFQLHYGIQPDLTSQWLLETCYVCQFLVTGAVMTRNW